MANADGEAPQPEAGRPYAAIVQLLVNSPVIVVTILGASLFALSRGAYTIYYRKYDVSLEELGLDYVTILNKQAFSIAVLILLVLFLLAPILQARMTARWTESWLRSAGIELENARKAAEEAKTRLSAIEEELGVQQASGSTLADTQQQRETVSQAFAAAESMSRARAHDLGLSIAAVRGPFAGRGSSRRRSPSRLSMRWAEATMRWNMSLARSGLVVSLLLIGGWVSVMFLQAGLTGPGPYSPPFAVSPLQADVSRVTPRWILTDGQGLGAPLSWSDLGLPARARAPEFLLLGSHDGVVVLYEQLEHIVLRLPASQIGLV